METYTLRIVTDFLRSNNIEFKYSSSRVGFGFYEHGCRIQIDDTYQLSIQTHTDVVGESFAETALQNKVTQRIVEDGTFDYYDVKRFDTPQDLFDHIKEVLNIGEKKDE